jgi:septal ring factor EnvC (AmiA/AmiB activator)
MEAIERERDRLTEELHRRREELVAASAAIDRIRPETDERVRDLQARADERIAATEQRLNERIRQLEEQHERDRDALADARADAAAQQGRADALQAQLAEQPRGGEKSRRRSSS